MNVYLRRGLLLALVVGLAGVCAARGEKTIRAVRTPAPPVLDGLLREPEWQSAQAVLDFTQFDPEEGAAPTELTSVRILYDDRALYVGVICYDSHPERIVRQLTRRDRQAEADRFAVMIDSYNDRKSAFLFSTSVSGVQSDGILSQAGTVYDIAWDAVWDVETRVYRDGWSAEFAIPFNVLRFAEVGLDSARWGINFRRYISRKRELDEWVMVPRSEQEQIPFWGALVGVADIAPPLHLTLSPYVSGSLATAKRTTVAVNTQRTWMAGLDAKYGLTRNFTLDATVNPDFGQVEVDEAVLNLTVFETLYPEKRPFFTEGAMLFTFGSSVDNTPLPLFFSRRIGKRPSGTDTVTVLADETVVELPQATTILGALKLSGKSRSGLAVGALSAATAQEEALLRGQGGTERSPVTEPRATYNAVRVRQEFADGSWLGGIATLAARDGIAPALSGGVDWNLRWGAGSHSLDGYLAAVRASSSPSRSVGTAGRLMLARLSAEHWFYAGSYSFFTRAFDINDLGFFARPHDHGGYAQLAYREFFAGGILRRYGVSVVPEARWNWDGASTMIQAEASAGLEFTNFWNAQLACVARLPAYDDAEQGIIGTYRRPASGLFSLQLGSDQRQTVVGTLQGSYEVDHLAKTGATVLLKLDIRPVSWMELSPGVLFQRVRNQETGVLSNGTIATTIVQGTTVSLFADRDVDQASMDLRGMLTFTRRLSLQFYLQMLLARGRYTNYRGLSSPTSFVPPAGEVGSYDFNQATLNANVLLRWEYMPGSTFYLVWTQARFGDSGLYDTTFRERLDEISLLPTQDVLLAKLSYWLPL